MKAKDLNAEDCPQKSTKKKTRKKQMGAPQIIALGFLVIIFIGTCLLMLPISSADKTFTSPVDAGFTAVSATCVTGLITVDTATHWNTFGHTVILLLIQLGGLGFMTMAVLFSLLIRRTITPKERMLVAMSYNLNSYESMTQLVKRIVVGTLAIETVGACSLAIRFVPDFGIKTGIFKSVFHSVSAFCNAGFDIVGVGNPHISSMAYYKEDPLVNLTLILLILLGGIGFLVWSDLINFARKRQRLSVYSRFVLIISAVLLSFGTVTFALFEWNNPETLGSFSSGAEKMMASLFQSVTWRTAGFATIPNGAFTQKSLFLGMMLMFIGGASGSTAGGVKVGTFGILVYTVWCTAIGKKQTVVFGRNISEKSFVRATAVICIQLAMIVAGMLTLTAAVPELEAIDVLYEAISAISTVGVTVGITPLLSGVGKIAVMILMYLGRIGAITVTYAIMNHQAAGESNIRYPDANMPIG